MAVGRCRRGARWFGPGVGWIDRLIRLSLLGAGLAGLAGWAVRASWLGEKMGQSSAAAVNEPKGRGIANIMGSINTYIGPN